ncbi:MAG: hypothetical protein ACREUR_09495 [Nitrosospira sp.]
MNEIVPRFEFRVFGHGFDAIEGRIRETAPCESINESREIYLLDNEDCDRNVKIRGSRLELKRLLERSEGLERWEPAGVWAFPVDLGAIPGRLFPVAALAQVSPFPAALTQRELLNHIAPDSERSAPLYRANIFKRRFRFTLQDCPVEIDHILVNGAVIESIAIESQHAERVLSVRSALAMAQFENVAYPLAISRIMGIRPLPDEEDYE